MDIKNYPRSPSLIIDITRKYNGCGGCNNYAMKSGVSQQNSWKTSDGSAWWLRNSKYTEPNGDYHANCYLYISSVDPNNVQFNDRNCNAASSDYLCQPRQGIDALLHALDFYSNVVLQLFLIRAPACVRQESLFLSFSCSRICAVWGGSCQNGALAVVSLRTQENHCGSCNAGYVLQEGSCKSKLQCKTALMNIANYTPRLYQL